MYSLDKAKHRLKIKPHLSAKDWCWVTLGHGSRMRVGNFHLSHFFAEKIFRKDNASEQLSVPSGKLFHAKNCVTLSLLYRRFFSCLQLRHLPAKFFYPVVRARRRFVTETNQRFRLERELRRAGFSSVPNPTLRFLFLGGARPHRIGPNRTRTFLLQSEPTFVGRRSQEIARDDSYR